MAYTVSTLTSSLRMADYLTRYRADVDRLAIESTSGKHADMGMVLGGQTGNALSFRSEFSVLNAQLDTNKQLIARLDVTNAALNNIEESATKFRSDLIALRSTKDTLSRVYQLAETELDKLSTSLNSNVSGVFVFGGINTGKPPVKEFDDGTATSPKQRIEDAFLARFGAPYTPPVASMDDPNIASIPKADLEDFLDNQFAAEFSDASWKANWSAATDETMTSTIDKDVTVSGSATANEDAYRSLAQGLAMVAVFGKLPLSADVSTMLIDKAVDKINIGIGETIRVNAQNGATKTSVERSNLTIETRKNVLNLRVNDLENVDKERAAVELNNAKTQLEVTYSVTAKIQNLNILKYL